jgi:hypothetical protein
MLNSLPKSDGEKAVTKLKRQITIIKNCKVDLFNNCADGHITEADFIKKNNAYNAEIERLENVLLNNQRKPNTDVIEQILHYKNFRKLTSVIINAFVSKIVVAEKNEIEIIFNFSEILLRISEYVKGGEIA